MVVRNSIQEVKTFEYLQHVLDGNGENWGLIKDITTANVVIRKLWAIGE